MQRAGVVADLDSPAYLGFLAKSGCKAHRACRGLLDYQDLVGFMGKAGRLGLLGQVDSLAFLDLAGRFLALRERLGHLGSLARWAPKGCRGIPESPVSLAKLVPKVRRESLGYLGSLAKLVPKAHRASLEPLVYQEPLVPQDSRVKWVTKVRKESLGALGSLATLESPGSLVK